MHARNGIAMENIEFAIVDFAYDPPIPNVQGIVFDTDEAAFLAGYLAAGMAARDGPVEFGADRPRLQPRVDRDRVIAVGRGSDRGGAEKHPGGRQPGQERREPVANPGGLRL
mgnify:CR=1 FL=1